VKMVKDLGGMRASGAHAKTPEDKPLEMT